MYQQILHMIKGKLISHSNHMIDNTYKFLIFFSGVNVPLAKDCILLSYKDLQNNYKILIHSLCWNKLLKDNKVGKRFDNKNLMQLVILTQVKYNLLNIMLRCFNH